MSYQIHKNTFEGGLDTNTTYSKVPSNKYVSATNINLVSTGNFHALENIKGTTNVMNFISSTNAVVLGEFASKYKIGDTEGVPCITSFIAINGGASSTFQIICYDTVNDISYFLYEETFDGTDYFTTDRVVSGVLYPENSIDIFYFTDFYNEIRKIKCEIPSPYVTNFLTPLDLKVIQHGANGYVSLQAINESGGSLFCGSYQIAYQLLNPSTNQFTNFSLFSNPIQVTTKSSSTSYTDSKSGVGIQTSKGIYVTITPSAEEIEYYTHFRLAVIENIEPNGINVSKAQLTPIKAISDFDLGSAIGPVPYTTNTRVGTIDISEILVDKAAIESVKTLVVRENRLVGGNIKYKSLDYDNGTPVINTGVILQQGGGVYDDYFSNDYLASLYRGYFRDEVYRFAISYYDENGNFSYPSVLNLASVVNNQIGSGATDMKFPARSQKIGSTTYSIMSASDGIKSLGLRLADITNHPKWARGFVILRAKRLKNVLFQTPVVPMNKVYSVGAIEEYPTFVNELSGTTTRRTEYAEADPMGPFTTFVPRNYLRLRGMDIVQEVTPLGATSSGANKRYTGEAKLSTSITSELAMIFPPSFMYENEPFTFSPNYTLDTVDAALLRGKYTDFSDINIGSTIRGRNIKTSVSGTFHALQDSYYYYDSNHSGAKTSISNNTSINSYKEFNNFDGGDIIGGFNVFRYDRLDTPGLHVGDKASTPKCAVIKLNSTLEEINQQPASPLSFTAGSQVAKSVLPAQDFYLPNDVLVHTIRIANVTSGLADGRYGSLDTPHEFISTGTVVVFSEEELEDVRDGVSLPKTVDVWGGDCYVTPHLFKLTDTSYGVNNSEKFENLGGLTTQQGVQNWEKSFNDINGGCTVSVPVPYKNAAQYVQVVLESEYNAGVMDNEVVNVLAGVGGLPITMPVYGLNSSSEGSCRVPLSYQLNHNHKKQNSDKVFQVKDPLLTTNTNFGSRFVYSDTKVYQTSFVGFDIFRVLNFKDLEEGNGKITKLEVVGNELYALQESAVSYIGIGERTLETTDALTLAVQSGTFVGNIIVVDNNKGCQHIKSVQNTGNAVYFMDNNSKSICRLAGRQIEVISEKDMASAFRNKLATTLDENKVLTIHDPILRQVWIVYNGASNQFCYVFDEARNIWVSNYTFPASTLYGGVYTNNNLYLIGKESSQINAHTMYTNTANTLFGVFDYPEVSFIVNPHPDVAKVFDNFLVPSIERLRSIGVSVDRETDLGDSSSVNLPLFTTSSRGEGNYIVQVLRGTGGERIRGTFGNVNIAFNPGTTVQVPSVLTKYRGSNKLF